MIDLHCHLLPGIDDGPSTIEESIELCRIAVADGITHAVVTPHIHPGRWENQIPDIQKKVDELLVLLTKRKICLKIGYAGEVRLTDQIMRQVERGEIPFYGQVDGYDVMLLEFPHGHIIPGSDKLVAWLLDRKIRPLIAHPERNKQVMKDVAQLQPFVSAGCWLQITAGSLLGNFGERAHDIAHALMRDELVTVVASDGHNVQSRKPVLREAYRAIATQYSEELARQVILEVPAEIISAQFPKAIGI